MSTPILLLLFNRPDYTKELLSKISNITSKHLFIAVDGPRVGNDLDTDNIRQVIELVESTSFAAEKVSKLYRENNLGCRHGVKAAIDWFFEHTEAGIILEDDCIPDNSFFTFCETMLEKYEHEESVFAICGTNFLLDKIHLEHSYYCSAYFHAWGWATWKRSWEKYDFNMTGCPELFNEQMVNFYNFTDDEKKHWESLFVNIYDNIDRFNSWAYPFSYTVWKHKGMCIAPARNLITNIGFDANATHTKRAPFWFKYLDTGTIRVNKHPKVLALHHRADHTEFDNIIKLNYAPPFLKKVQQRLKRFLHFL